MGEDFRLSVLGSLSPAEHVWLSKSTGCADFAGAVILTLRGSEVCDGAHRLIVMKNSTTDLSLESHFSKREKWGSPLGCTTLRVTVMLPT